MILDGKPNIEFPVNFDLKVVMEMKDGEGVQGSPALLEENRKKLLCILDGLKIPHFDWRTRFSSERRYVSFSVNITLADQGILDCLYEEMKKEPTIRFAV